MPESNLDTKKKLKIKKVYHGCIPWYVWLKEETKATYF